MALKTYLLFEGKTMAVSIVTVLTVVWVITGYLANLHFKKCLHDVEKDFYSKR